jgi:hypothetical protein
MRLACRCGKIAIRAGSGADAHAREPASLVRPYGRVVGLGPSDVASARSRAGGTEIGRAWDCRWGEVNRLAFAGTARLFPAEITDFPVSG